jgi:hypothetical protein
METRKAQGNVQTLVLFFPYSPDTCSGTCHNVNEIFQALAVEGDILLPKPYQGLSFDSVIRWK